MNIFYVRTVFRRLAQCVFTGVKLQHGVMNLEEYYRTDL